MADPTASTLSPHFTNLIGRRVTFTRVVSPPKSTATQVYGVYNGVADEDLVVVRADLPLLGSFAGALVGIPDTDIRRRVLSTEIDESLRDPIYEVLNVAAAVVAPGRRVVLNKVAHGVSDLGETAKNLMAKPNHSVDFDVAVADYQGGRFTVLS